MKGLILSISFVVSASLAIGQGTCVDFSSSNTEVKLGDFVQFANLSSNSCKECGDRYTAKSYSWTFQGGSPVSSAEKGPVDVKFVEVGTFEVQLTVSYYSSDPAAKPCVKTVKKKGYIKVNPTKSIELESFEANAYSSKVKLFWTAIYEKGNNHFIVKRAPGGKHQKPIGEVKSEGDHSKKTIYTFEDTEPEEGPSDYKLYSYSNDGKKELISSLSIKWYDINAALNIAEGEAVLVIVEGSKGEEIYSKVVIKEASAQKIFAVDPSHKIHPGTYTILGSSKNEIFDKTLVVETN